MIDYLNLLLEGHPSCVSQYARHLIGHGGVLSDRYGPADAQADELEHWSLTRDQWSLAKRCALFGALLERLTPRCPAMTLSPSDLPTTPGHHFVLRPGEQLRPLVLESWLGREVDAVDEMILSEMAKVLPSGWMVVLQSRGRFTIDKNTHEGDEPGEH